MPDKPGTVYLTWGQHGAVWRSALGAYLHSWTLYFPPKEEKKAAAGGAEGAEGKAEGAEEEEEEAEPSYQRDPNDTTTFKDELGMMYRAAGP